MPVQSTSWAQSFQQSLRRLSENPLLRRVIKNSGYLFSSTGISAALGMLQGILVARLLGVEQYGILGTITMFVGVVNNLTSFRMSELVIKYVGHYEEKGDSHSAAAIFKGAALFEVLASCLAFGLAYGLAPAGAQFFLKDVATTGFVRVYSVVILINLIAESSTGLLQISDRFRRMAGLIVAVSIVSLAVTILVYLTGGGLLGVLVAYMVGKASGALGLTVAALYEARRRWGASWWRVPLNRLHSQRGELARFAVSTNISATLSLITKDSEILWVSLLRNPVEAGYYKLALTLSNIVQMPVNPLPQATYPELSRQAARQDWRGMRSILRQGSLLAGSYTLAATIFLVLFGRPLISLLYKPEFLPAYPALMILLVGFLVANVFYWRRSALLALGRADFPAKLNAALAVIKIVLTFLLTPRFGYLVSAALLSGFYWAASFISALKIRALVREE